MNKEAKPQPDLVPLGRVVGVHGLKGMIRVGHAGRGDADPETFAALGEILVGGKRFVVRKASRGRKHVLLGLKGLETREQAEALVGREVQGESRRFPALPPGEYYWFEIWPTGAHDVYVVRQGTREILLPAVEEVIQEIDLQEGCLKVWPPEGLLDLYAD